MPLGGDLLSGVSSKETAWAPQTWASTQERWALLAGWRNPRTNRRAVGRLNVTYKEHTCWLMPEGAWRGIFKNCCSSCLVSNECPSWCPNPSQENTPDRLTAHHTTALDLGLPWPRRKFDCRRQGQLNPRAASTRGDSHHCWCLLKRNTKSSPDLWHWPLHHSSHSNMCWESVGDPPALWCGSKQGRGGRSWGQQ